MSASFEELDRRSTPMGEISLRRRREPVLEVDVFEARLDEEFLMSSLFTSAEVELARLGLAEVAGGADLDVAVGGLGLGYTALAVLEESRVRSLQVVETLPEVIAWHERRLLPTSASLVGDARCHLVPGDFFALIAHGAPLGTGSPDHFHAVLVDIDHAPDRLLAPSHAGFYEPEGLARVAARLHPGGVFALWSDDRPDDCFLAIARGAFASCRAEVVTFTNPLTGGAADNTVYVARA